MRVLPHTQDPLHEELNGKDCEQTQELLKCMLELLPMGM